MRWLFPFLFLATPALTWEVKTLGPVCLLIHEMDGAKVTVSHDPRKAMAYGIELRRDSGWVASDFFAMRFEGPGQLTISTDRHRLSEDGGSLTVEDSGFGNVLNGLAFNETAIAIAGEQALAIPLAGAAPKVDAFRSCLAGLTS